MTIELLRKTTKYTLINNKENKFLHVVLLLKKHIVFYLLFIRESEHFTDFLIGGGGGGSQKNSKCRIASRSYKSYYADTLSVSL